MPLGKPLDRFLADRVVKRKALTKATDGKGLEVDLTFVMAGFEFGKCGANDVCFVSKASRFRWCGLRTS